MKRIKESIKKFKDSKDMVSEIVGTALILIIAVAAISSLYSTVLSYPSPSDPSFVNLVGMVEGNNIIIEHRGGDALSLGTKVRINIGEETIEFIIADVDYLDDKAKENNQWNIGERFVYPYSLGCSEVEITVIDESNTIIMKGTLDIS